MSDFIQMQEALIEARDTIRDLTDELGRVYDAPTIHATVVKAENKVNPSVFEGEDMVLIVEESWVESNKSKGRTARIIGKKGKPSVDSDGSIRVQLPDMSRHIFFTGAYNSPRQVKLLGKDDGTHVVISTAGDLHEVNGMFGKEFNPGDVVKVNLSTKQIIEPKGIANPGAVCVIKTVLDKDQVEVEIDGRSKLVFNGIPDVKLEVGDRVVIDHTSTIIVRKLMNEADLRHQIKEGICCVDWQDIGGCEEAKQAIIETIELPYTHEDVYKFYNKKLPKGVLFYGPPGCGKSMFAKATATSLAKRFGHEWTNTGFIAVKGPELISPWVGVAERNIRELFIRAKKHYDKSGHPAVCFIDEAESILPVRGSGRSTDIEKTIVPMFLSEMDGFDDSRCIVILATNRPKMIDPAVVRPGRIDHKIKIPRPDQATAVKIFRIHLKNVPLSSDWDAAKFASLATAEIFSKQRTLYKISQKDNPQPRFFTLADCMSGALIANVVEQAVNSALRRDLNKKKKVGVRPDDLENAIVKIHKNQLDANHMFDLEDYLDSHNLDVQNCSIEKSSIDS